MQTPGASPTHSFILSATQSRGVADSSLFYIFDLTTNASYIFAAMRKHGYTNNTHVVRFPLSGGASGTSLANSSRIDRIDSDATTAELFYISYNVHKMNDDGSSDTTLYPTYSTGASSTLGSIVRDEGTPGTYFVYSYAYGTSIIYDGAESANRVVLAGSGIAIDEAGGYVFFEGTDYDIHRRNLALASGSDTSITTRSYPEQAKYLVFGNSTLFYLASVGGLNRRSIRSCTNSGGSDVQIYSTSNEILGLAVDTTNSKLIFGERRALIDGDIVRRCNFNGSNVETIIDNVSY